MVVVGVSLAAVDVVLVAAADAVVVVDSETAVVVVVVDDVCTVDETIDAVVTGFGEPTGFGLSSFRGLARLCCALNETGTADAPFAFGSFGRPAMDAVVVVVAVAVATELPTDVLFSAGLSSVFDLMLNMCFSSFVIVMVLADRMPFGALYDNEVIAASGFGGGWSVVCGDD